ncbi:MAG TPA: GTP diphosphokinase, partial [Spongiibacteraceae bacterium]|nr:GTP diphosphokinase [Spongiibacteraceae bacterium]
MVKVREEHPEKADGSVDLERWVRRLPVPESVNRGTLLRACGVTRAADERAQPDPEVAWGEDRSCLPTGLEMAEILADLHVDQDGLVAAILYRAVREGKLSTSLVEDQFGAPIAKLIDGVLRMAAISRVRTGDRGPVLGQIEDQSDTVRKMLVAMVDDVRVALIKLAERTCAIRAVKNSPEKRYRVAREVADIYAPLAHRLGIGHIKWELEDLSFRYLQPDSYKKIAKLLDEKRLDRQGYIGQVIAELRAALEQAGIKAEFSGRAKHIYSIWRKMQRKGIGFSQVYDIRAVRVLVPEVKDCYAALGIVHGLWRNVPNEFDDYIANPKDNGYRSLHTAVIGPAGKVLEVQIRSFDMHEEAEFGVCAHWRYKGADKQHKTVNSYEEKIAWLRQVLEWHEETGAVSDLTEQFSRAQDRVYVFTPEGHVINLEHGSTPLDFAYHIHTEVGHRCRGAKVNGRIVPLTYVLQTGEQVEILTGKDNSPRRDWLQANLGYLKGTRARAKVQTWFRQQAREDNIAAGRNLLEKEFKRLALTSLDYKSVAERVRSATVEDMYAAVGVGSLSATQVLHAAQALLVGDEQVELPPQLLRKRASKDQAGAVHIRGVGNLLTHIAGCCKPVPGDAIIGYITVGRGVSVHRQDCAKILQLQYAEPERIIEVSWGDEQATYPVEVAIHAHDRQGLLRDITQLFATERIN